MRKAYQSDLSDEEWSFLEPLLPAPRATGRPKTHSTREVFNAIFYIVRGGCAWRLLPHDFPPWKSVYHYFRSRRLETVPGKGCTTPCASVCGSASRGTPSLERSHSG